jgi:hypothetical protein
MAKSAAPKSQRLRIVTPAKVEHLTDHDVVITRIYQLMKPAFKPGKSVCQALPLARQAL